MALRWRRCLQLFLHINSCTQSVSFAAPSCHTVHNLSCRERRFSTACCDITSSEALRALRPFYLAVHPDLFPQHPQERTTNEDSLKKLNSYLDALVVSGCGQGGGTAVRSVAPSVRPKPIQLTFFVRGRQSENLKSVSVSLDAYSVGSAVHDILQSCDLFADVSNPTISKLLRTKHQENEKNRVMSTYKRYKSHHHHHHQQEPLQDYPDFDYIFSERNTGKTDVQYKRPECLRDWLKHNLSLARSRLDLSRRLRAENDSLKERICSRHGLRCIEVNPDWTAATVKGHLLSLEKTLGVATRTHSSAALESGFGGGGGVKVVLGHSGSFVSVRGEVHLSCEDTVQQWLQYLLSHAVRELEIVRAIDTLEEELLDMMNSNSPGGDSCYIRLVLKRPSTVHVTPSEYHSQLKDYFSQQLPSHNLHTGTGMTMDRGHDNNTDDIIITIVTKSQAGLGGPFLSEDGTVEVPMSCSLSTLRDFCLKNRHKISESRRKHERSMDEMLQTIQMCKQKLFLSELRVKANIKNDQIRSSCQRLLQLARDKQETATGACSNELDLQGHYLTLTNSYSVSSDGQLRIPWDFRITSP